MLAGKGERRLLRLRIEIVGFVLAILVFSVVSIFERQFVLTFGRLGCSLFCSNGISFVGYGEVAVAREQGCFVSPNYM